MRSSKNLPDVNSKVAVLCDDEHQKQCTDLAASLQLTLIKTINEHFDYVLFYLENKLALKSVHQKFSPIFVDFTEGKVWHRFKYGGGRGQLIARACGAKSKEKLNLLDLTAGLGQDAFVLASLGFNVTMLERSSIVSAILKDGLMRAAKEKWFADISLQLVQQDAKSYLKNLNKENIPDVIYYDPMFPESKKTALVKKEMRMIRDLVGEDSDAGEILKIAITKAKKRVVVKRPKLGEVLTGKEPDLNFIGKSGRFDVYLAGK